MKAVIPLMSFIPESVIASPQGAIDFSRLPA